MKPKKKQCEETFCFFICQYSFEMCWCWKRI